MRRNETGGRGELVAGVPCGPCMRTCQASRKPPRSPRREYTSLAIMWPGVQGRPNGARVRAFIEDARGSMLGRHVGSNPRAKRPPWSKQAARQAAMWYASGMPAARRSGVHAGRLRRAAGMPLAAVVGGLARGLRAAWRSAAWHAGCCLHGGGPACFRGRGGRPWTPGHMMAAGEYAGGLRDGLRDAWGVYACPLAVAYAERSLRGA